jgi:protein-tyrosine phosphatase
MDANEIIPGIWIGNRRAAADGEWLNTNKILAVFNCTKDLPFHPTVRHQYRIPVDDNLEPVEIKHMELWAPEIAVKILREHRQGPVLIHCHAGMQRSTAACSFFLMALTGKSLREVMTMIKRQRPIAFHPYANFAQAMQGFEAELSKARKS